MYDERAEDGEGVTLCPTLLLAPSPTYGWLLHLAVQ